MSSYLRNVPRHPEPKREEPPVIEEVIQEEEPVTKVRRPRGM